ncbi:GumC family protein [Candidatus Latescibacterota bacterium]
MEMNNILSESTLSEFTLKDFYYIIFRNKKKILFIFFATLILSVAYVIRIPDLYISEAMLYVRVGRENINMIPTSDASNTFTISPSEVLNEIQLIKSREVIEALVSEIGFQPFMKNNEIPIENLTNAQYALIRESIVLYLSDNIIVNSQDTDIIDISYANESPELAQMVVSKLINISLEKHFEIHYSSSASDFNFYEEQLAQTQLRLMAVEDKINDIHKKLNISSFEDQRIMLINRTGTLQEQLDRNNTAISASKSKIQNYEQKLNELPDTLENESFTSNEYLIKELYSLQLKERELLSKYSEENVNVETIRSQIDEVNKQIANGSHANNSNFLTYQQVNQDLISEQASIDAVEAQNTELEKMISDINQELQTLSTTAIDISRLQREKTILSDTYVRHSRSLEESRIDEVVQKQNILNVSILQPATYPQFPVQSRKLRNLALGLFFGLFGGIGLAFVSEYLDHSIRRKEDIEERLQLRMLGSIPLSSQK